MFSKAEFDVVGFSSAVNLKDDGTTGAQKSVQDSTCQTETSTGEGSSQSMFINHSEIQTEEVVQNLNTDYDVNNLASFLSRVCPNIIQELDKVEKSKAFTLYNTVRQDKESNKGATNLFTIDSKNKPQLSQLKVSSIAWSCTGNVLSFGFESAQHMDWCAHNSSVHFYNIETSDFDGKTPTYSIPTMACVSSLATHPYEPAIVAVGTVGGDVHIWNLQKGEFDVDMGNALSHGDRVTKASWENISSQLFLVTSSLDGQMFFFKVNPRIGSTVLVDRYAMSNDISDSLKPGITTYGFSSQAGVFVVALESGELVHCSTFGAALIPSTTLKNPVLRTVHKLKVPVSDVKFSPFIEHLFIVSSLDNRVIVYSIKETAPLQEIYLEFDVFGVFWSFTQANIFFMWGRASKVLAYNSETGKLVAELQPEATTFQLITSVCLYSKNPRLALAGENGEIVIWEIPELFKT